MMLLYCVLFLGMIDITRDPDYADVYNDLPLDQTGDLDMAEERRFFMNHVDDIIMRMIIFSNSLRMHRNLFLLDSDWSITSIIHLLDDKIDSTGYERLNARLQLHEILLKSHLCKKMSIKKHVFLLKIVAFLVPLFVTMRKRMRIPEIVTRLLPRMSGR